MTKKQIKAAAVYYAGSVVYNTLGSGAYVRGMTEKEQEIFAKEVQKIGESILNRRTGGLQSLQLGTLEELAELAQEIY